MMMTKEIYLERYYKLRLDVNFIYSKSIEFQVPSNIIEQILCLGENCEDVINEIKKFDTKNQSPSPVNLGFYQVKTSIFHNEHS